MEEKVSTLFQDYLRPCNSTPGLNTKRVNFFQDDTMEFRVPPPEQTVIPTNNSNNIYIFYILQSLPTVFAFVPHRNKNETKGFQPGA